jgi:hypothetical protein
MQSCKALALAFFLIVGSAAGQANANIALPENAKPLSPEETRDIYKDKTIDFKIVKYYFGSDSRIAGYSRSPRSFATGTWSVSDNEFCMSVVWRGSRRAYAVKYHSCSQWFSDGSTYWTKIVRNSSRQLVGRVYKGDEKMMASGDSVSAMANKIKSRFGY